MTNALSRKSEFATMTTVRCNIQDAARERLKHDPKVKQLMKLATQGKTRRLWIEDGLLSYIKINCPTIIITLENQERINDPFSTLFLALIMLELKDTYIHKHLTTYK